MKSSMINQRAKNVTIGGENNRTHTRMHSYRNSDKNQAGICNAWLVLVLIFVMLGVVLPRPAQAITVEEIMKKVDDFQYATSFKMKAQMIIVNGKREMVKEMTLIGQGKSALVEFTNAKDRGTKFLKVNDDLWMFFPDAEDIVKISGHMLEQGLMGSDFSYQDAMEEEKYTELYTAKVVKEENIGDRPAYVIESILKPGAKASYYRRLSWIDKERFVVLKEEMYAQSGRLLKTVEAKKVEKIGNRWYSTDTIMISKLKKDTSTEMKILSIEFDVKIPADTFSLKKLH